MKPYLYLLLLTLQLYITSIQSEDFEDKIIYAYQWDTTTFSIGLALPEKNTKEVCVEGRIGNSTQGDPDMQYCSKSSFEGWRPNLCIFPTSSRPMLWTFIAIQAPKAANLSTINVTAEAIDTIHGTTGYEIADVLITDEETTPLCCGSTAIHRISIITNESDVWGLLDTVANIEMHFSLHIYEGDISNLTFSIQRDPCGPAIKSGVYEEGYSVMLLNLGAHEFKNFSYGDYYIVVKSGNITEEIVYGIQYSMQANPYPCAGSRQSGVCNGLGSCIDGTCKCTGCISGLQCDVVETCSLNGVCNVTTGKCVCDNQHTGDFCEFDGTVPNSTPQSLSGGGIALLAIGMFILGSIAGVGVLLVVNKKIRRAVYSEVSIQERDFQKAVS